MIFFGDPSKSVTYALAYKEAFSVAERLAGPMALIGMRRLFLLVLLFACRRAFAEQHEIGLTLGGLFPQDRGTIPNTVRLGGGTALQANYGHRLISGRAALFAEVHFVANPQRLVGSGKLWMPRAVDNLKFRWGKNRIQYGSIPSRRRASGLPSS
jgi:hypothetical protein